MESSNNRQYDDFIHLAESSPRLLCTRIVKKEEINRTKKLLVKKAKRNKLTCAYNILKNGSDEQTAAFFIPEKYKRKKFAVLYTENRSEEKIKLIQIPFEAERTQQNDASRLLRFNVENSGQYILTIYRKIFIIFWLLGLALLTASLLLIFNSVIGGIPTIGTPNNPAPKAKVFVFTFDENGIPLENESRIGIFDSIGDVTDEYGKPVVIKDKIAPGVKGVYNFEINNSVNGYDLDYSFTFSNENLFRIPLVFKVKKNNEYIVGGTSYAEFGELAAIGQQSLGKGGKDFYQIEWMWRHTEGDTQIGAAHEASYTLKIKVVGTSK